MLFQFGSQKIEVIVRKENSASVLGANEKDTDQLLTNSQDQSTSVTSLDTSPSQTSSTRRFLTVNITHGLSVAKQIGTGAVNLAISQIGNENGDQALQQSVSRSTEIFQDVTNVATSIATGAAYGAQGGPIGAIIGATLGGISSGVSILFKYVGREREFNFKEFKENNAIEYQRARASISLTTGRLR